MLMNSYQHTHNQTWTHTDTCTHGYTDVGTRRHMHKTCTRTRTAAPRTGPSGCASLCTVLAAARPAHGPACASASAQRLTHRPATQAQGKGLRGPCWARLDVPRAAPLPGQLLLKASGPEPSEKERCGGARQARGGGKSGGQCRGGGTGRRGSTAHGQCRPPWPPPRRPAPLTLWGPEV